MTTMLDTELPLIVRLLIAHDLLSREKLDAVGAARKRFSSASIEEALVYAELCDDRTIAKVHGAFLGVDSLDLEVVTDTERHIIAPRDDEQVDRRGDFAAVVDACREVAQAISESVCRGHLVMPVAVKDEAVDLACVNPSDFTALEEVRMRTGFLVRPFAGTLGLIAQLVSSTFGEHDVVASIGAEDDDVEHTERGEGEDDETEVIVDLQRPTPAGRDSQVIRIVNAILGNSIEEGASDIHIEPYEDNVRVRYRIDGKLREVSPPPRSLFVPTISRLKILAKMDIAEKRIPQDGAIALKNGNKRVDLRVSTVPTVYGEKMCIRLLEKEGIPDRLQKLGFSDWQAEKFLDGARSPHGLMFVTGPTGSGKSTTLYCCLNLINEPTENIVTVEDPVEYKFFGLNQVHVRSKVGLTFATALRSFLRQDPDKIMVGEVRDQETAEICMRAALTGHLVLSTLHTNNALQVVNRLVDMGIEPFLLGPALRLLEAQRLARKLCDDCKEPYELPDDAAEAFGLEPGLTVYRAGRDGKCKTCRGGGVRGRVGIYEVIPISDALKELIVRKAEQTALEEAARAEGIRFLADAAREKIAAGLIAVEEVADYVRKEKPRG